MKSKHLVLGFLALPLLAFGGTGFERAAAIDPGESLRILLVGDTGQVPVPDNPHKMDQAQRQQLRDQLVAQGGDAILDLGDLFYDIAPKCGPGTTTSESGEILDAHLYDHVGGLDQPVLLALGNHDVGPYGEYIKRRIFGRRAGKRSRKRERCYRLYDQQHPDMVFPGESYGVDLGPARLAVLHTSAPERQWEGGEVSAFFAEEPDDWELMAGHHVLRTACDKVGEDFVGPWLAEQGLQPDMWLNGHAHILQMGVFDGVPAVTSGSGSKLREFPGCEPAATPGVRWGVSEYGFAVLDVTQETLRVSFKDLQGAELYCWERDRSDPEGRECP